MPMSAATSPSSMRWRRPNRLPISAATAPVLVIVGAMMFELVRYLEWNDPVIALPVLLSVGVMQDGNGVLAKGYGVRKLGSPEREHSVRQMIGRVAGTISNWGREGGYFASEEDADAFEMAHPDPWKLASVITPSSTFQCGRVFSLVAFCAASSCLGVYRKGGPKRSGGGEGGRGR